MRTFRDREGTAWRVYEATDDAARDDGPRERRIELRSRSRQSPGARLTTRPLNLPCLYFESATSRRRFGRVPSGWADLDDAELEDLMGLSKPAAAAAAGEVGST